MTTCLEPQDLVVNKPKYKLQIVWRNVAIFAVLHLLALQGMFYMLTFTANWKTSLYALFVGVVAGQGITAGAHRLWSHRSYKAKFPLRVVFCLFQTLALQNSVIEWARDHRVHHKFTDTDADPHNSRRGFFFSHMGWLLCRKHPDVTLKGKTVDMSDLESDPVLAFQKKYYLVFGPLISLGLPAIVPIYFWNENWYIAYIVSSIWRYLITLHFTWLVNSAAHMWGYKPYDVTINPVQNKLVSCLTFGEGWHNYHHVFPWDYRARELDGFSGSFTTACIDFFAKIGWAYNLKTASPGLVKKRVLKTGNLDVY